MEGMTEGRTPTKIVNCFFCGSRPNRFKVKGYREGIIATKIACLTGEDRITVLNFATNETAGMCRPCHEQLNRAYDFAVSLKQKVVVGESSARYKRMAVSPITPKMMVDTPSKNPSKRAASVKRSLVLPDPDPVPHQDSLQPTDISEADHPYCYPMKESTLDHSYSQADDVSRVGTKEMSQLSPLENMKLAIVHEETGVDNTTIKDIITQISSNKSIMEAVQSSVLNNIDKECSTLVSRTAALGSVLSRWRSVNSLVENGDKLLQEIVQEMADRVPFLLDLFTTIVTSGKEPSESKVAHVVAAYAILMNARSDRLSAWHRMTTFVAIKGHLEDYALTRLNHMGLTLSATSKLRLLDEAGNRMETSIAARLRENPIVKITGDNLDIYVKTGHKSLERSNQDLHLFASNIMFSRIVRPGLYSMVKPNHELHELTPERFFPSDQDRASLRRSYCVIIGRILMELPPFKWLRSVVPSHINHPHQAQMSQQSEVFQLPIQMKNEAKHEDCVDILDGYEDILTGIFDKAFGSDELLHTHKVVVGGDQLTRVRLEEAKHLRALATTPKKRFEDLQPFVVELWHVKQDFLEKCYKELFKPATLRQPGTLYNLKSKLQRTDVTGKVKGAFKPHHDFLSIIGNAMILEQLLEFFGMEGKESEPTKNIPEVKRGLVERERVMYSMLEEFLDHYGYLDNFHEATDVIRSPSLDDTVFNYTSNLCHWYLHLSHMEDVVKEGDVVRLIPTLKYSLQFFFSHSRLSKYFVECLDFILKSEFLLSPQQRMRVLEGAFVNLRGGAGQNMESDLVQENSVRNQKDLIRALGANKTDRAIDRCTKAAGTVADICSNVDVSVTLKKQSSRHSIPKSVKDHAVIYKSLRDLRPFAKKTGRNCPGMPHVEASPLRKIDTGDFKYRINQVVSRLFYGQNTAVEDVSDDEYDDFD